MKSEVLFQMMAEGSFDRAVIEWCNLHDDIKKDQPYWIVKFRSSRHSEIYYPLDTARGHQKQFRTIETALKSIREIVEHRTIEIIILPNPWD